MLSDEVATVGLDVAGGFKRYPLVSPVKNFCSAGIHSLLLPKRDRLRKSPRSISASGRACDLASCIQKFSTIHILPFWVDAWIAKCRPSGEGTPQTCTGEPLPFCCHSSEGLPFKST
jgi:hypothetical protein